MFAGGIGNPMDERRPPYRWTTSQGETLTLRAIAPDDVGRSQAFLRSLSFGTRYFRFGRGDFVYSDEELEALCRSEPAGGAQFVVTCMLSGQEMIIGSARFVPADAPDECEFAAVVDDRWQRRGIGHRLLRALIDEAASRGLRRMHGKVLASNRGMISFVEQLGFTLDPSSAPQPIKRVVRSLQP